MDLRSRSLVRLFRALAPALLLAFAAAGCEPGGSGPHFTYGDASGQDTVLGDAGADAAGEVADDTADAVADSTADVVSDSTPDVVSGDVVCEPDCEGLECGDDGCGGTCGACPGAAPFCVEGLCQVTCEPDCEGRECGDDGCGGTCGTCPGAAPICADHLCYVDEPGEPAIEVDPTHVDFGVVTPGEEATRSVTVLNAGDGPLEVTGFALSGDPAFTFVLGPDEWTASAGSAVTFEEPWVVAPGVARTAEVRFSPTDEAEAQGELLLKSSDPQAPGTAVTLVGNAPVKCISVAPKEVWFGGQLVGEEGTVEVEITSCGDGALHIAGLALSEDASPDYSLDLGGLPGVDDGVEALLDGKDDPVELAPGASATFEVTFAPGEVAGLDPQGQAIPDLGRIRIVSNAPDSPLDVDLRGYGVEQGGPTPVIVVQEGEEVIPQTELHLVGSGSYASDGEIVEYQWSVQQPSGSQSVFVPNASVPDPTFEVNVAGEYVFELRVWDADGAESFVQAQYMVVVQPDAAIHVELLWDTPLDPDQTDMGPEAGADLDLHFLHPFAAGEDVDKDGEPDGWFDQPFDCFWFNPIADWGSLDPDIDDNPSLDRDDTDGAGPENLNFDSPEDGLTYKVGVHYWNDHGFGPSTATVRVYIEGELTFEESLELENHDLWEVATIAWPEADVTLVTGEGGGHKVIPNYQHPFFANE